MLFYIDVLLDKRIMEEMCNNDNQITVGQISYQLQKDFRKY